MPMNGPQTTLAASLALCGLTPANAARWFDVEERIVRDWISGRTQTPPGVFDMLGRLFGRMTDVALAASTVARGGPGAPIPLRAYIDDVDDPYPGHGEVMAGAMAVLLAIQCECRRADL